MKIYALAHHKTPPHLTVTTHESRAAAEAFLVASGATGSVAEDEADLRTLAGPVLVAIYNDVRPDGSDPVTRFTTKADAARRTFAALEARYQNQAVEAAAPSTVSTDSAANDKTKPHEEIAAEVVKLWSRERGASHAETPAVVVEKFPKKKEAALHNTLRGCVNSIPKTTGRKLTKTKDEKRGLVYNLA